MASFGEAFRLTLITDDVALAGAADRAGVDRIGLDFERIGKAQRQAGEDTRLSDHSWDALGPISRCLTRADLFVRVNPLNPHSSDEIERALRHGARVLMLPFFHGADEVDRFVRLVAGRAAVIVLLETAPAAVRIREVLAVPGIDEVMLGLNDLRLQFGVESHFEVLASPLLDALAGEVRRAGLLLSVGGVARADDAGLPISPDLVYAQFPRLGATGAWLARSFFHAPRPEMAPAIGALRRRLTEWASASPQDLERARNELAAAARRLSVGRPNAR